MTCGFVLAQLVLQLDSLLPVLVSSLRKVLDLLLHLIESRVDVLLGLFVVPWLGRVRSCIWRNTCLLCIGSLTPLHLCLLDLMHLQLLDLLPQLLQLFVLPLLPKQEFLIEFFLVLEALDCIFKYANLT